MKCDHEQIKFTSYHVIILHILIYNRLVYYQAFNNTFVLLRSVYTLIIYIIKIVITTFQLQYMNIQVFEYGLNTHLYNI